MARQVLRSARFVGSGVYPLFGTLVAGVLLTVASLMSV